MLPKQPAIGYRRNGKKQACEPCRKGKLACDHGAPFCGRCVRRKTTAKCIYHPAPMTRRGTEIVPAPRHSPSLASAQNASSGSSQVATAFNETISTSCTALPGSRSGGYVPTSEVFHRYDSGKAKDGWKDAEFPQSARFYGPTSFSAIFSESQVRVDRSLLDIGSDNRKHPGAWPFGQPLLGRSRPGAPSVRESQTIKALWNIPTREICDLLFRSCASIRDLSLDLSIVKYCNSTLWSAFGTELNAPRSETPLLVLSDALFRNEEDPLPSSPDDGIAWLHTFMGANIRFEMMGIYFAFLGLAYLGLQEWDPLFNVPENDGRDRKHTAWRMKECADVCLQMCDCAETINYLVSSLILNIKRLETGCTGDDTYKIRRHHGDLVTTAITSGLHRLPDYGTSKITSASEYKRRLFCSIYLNDKTHASLNGTPPLLTRTFCNVQPCLDLSDDSLFLSQEELALEISKLDANGWNTSGTYHLATLLRAKVILSDIRENILEIALGVNIEVSEQSIAELRQRSQQVYDSLPPQIQYYAADGTPKDSLGGILYNQAHLLLQHLQNKFLIDRVAIARGLITGQALVTTAMHMLDTCLMYYKKRDQLLAFSFNFDWILFYYGIPSAGVICVEILKTSSGQESAIFSRSDAIQKLTLFIAFLEWVRPTDGNYVLASRLRKVVRRVLDHVLEAPQKEPEALGIDIPFDSALATFDDMNDLDWLNTIDWTQGSWMEFN